MKTLAAIFLLTAAAFAQGGAYAGSPVINGVGQPIASASVAISSANPCGTSPSYVFCNGQAQGIYAGPLPPLSPVGIFTDITLASSATNPLLTDPLGNWTVYSSPGIYWATVYGYQITPQVQPIVVSNGSGAAGNCPGALNGSIAAFLNPNSLSCDLFSLTDFLGNLSSQSYQALGATNGFVGLTGGVTDPVLSDANTFYWLAPDTVVTPYALKPPTAIGTTNQFLGIQSITGNVAKLTWFSGGAGTVTSVSQVNPTGVLSQTGGPVTTAGTFTWSWAGTSGGIPCFDSATSQASSALLTNHALMLGAGAGACPTVLGSLGTTTTVLHGNAAGAPAFSAITLADLPASVKTRGIAFSIGAPGGSALTVASTTTAYVTVPYACTISAYNLVIDAGTITVKFWKVATGTAIPTSGNSINTSGVGISSGTAIHSTTVSDFTTTTVTANDIMAMNVTAVATAAYVNGVLECDQ